MVLIYNLFVNMIFCDNVIFVGCESDGVVFGEVGVW